MVKIGMLLPEERMVEPARKIIEENRDKEYRFQLEEPFNEKDLKEETIVILGLIKQELQWRLEHIFWLPEDIRRS